MKTRLIVVLALLLIMVQGLWAQTPMTSSGENTWTAPMPAYNIQLHAEYWGEFAISYELDGGVNHAENPDMYYEDEEVTLKAPSKEGYTFTGWTGSNGDTPQEVVTIAQYSTGDKNYVANWEAGHDPELPTGVEDVHTNDIQCTKVLMDGQIFIIRDGKTYNLMGLEIK